ncbi:MAG: hypothetical protein JWM83_2275 [Candidatus Angelobacter sp.]|nr:hypothetical protein [Candidatus Angelobacter sp.]
MPKGIMQARECSAAAAPAVSLQGGGAVLASPSGHPLPGATRKTMERRFARDFSGVKVHTDPSAGKFADQLNAQAVTLGLDVYFRAGLYRPDTPAGQALITHELGHIARSSTQGPATPRLQPKLAPDHWTALRTILEDPKANDKAFTDYVKAHADSARLASLLLADEMVKGPVKRSRVVNLLHNLIKEHPEIRPEAENYLRAITGELRARVTQRVMAMWKEYKEAAYLDAFKQGAEKSAGDERRKRKRGETAPTDLESQYLGWGKNAGKRLADQRSYSKAVSAAKSAVQDLMYASGATKELKDASGLAVAQDDLLNDLNDRIQADIGKARRTRLDSYYDYSYVPKPDVIQRWTKAKEQQVSAELASKLAESNRAMLEIVPASETPALKKVRLRKLEAAKQAETQARTKSQDANQAYERIIHDKDVDEYLLWKERQAQSQAQQWRADEMQERDESLRGILPPKAPDSIFDDAQRWSIYHKALQNIGSGFSGFAMEHTISVVLDARSGIANRQATGIENAEGIDTYLTHGEGQYDIQANAGKEVKAALPGSVDLSYILGPTKASGRILTSRKFTRKESRVRPGSKGSADADVLNKLDWGFFGRSWTQDQKKAFLDDKEQKFPARDPMPERLLGAVLFEDTIAESSLSKPIEEARGQIRERLEEAIRADLMAQGLNIDEKVQILRSVNASAGGFGRGDMVDSSAFAQVINPKTQKAFSKTAITDLVMNAARQAVQNDENIIADVKQLIKTLRANVAAGDLAGPTVQVVHSFTETATQEQVWIVVTYIHLREIAAGLEKNKPLTQDQVMANVGSGTNAISPHVHMSIAVYRNDPGEHKSAIPIGYLDPLDFFPAMRRAN